MYVLGVDLGTTYSAAAVWRDGRAEIASLGSRAAAIPSVVLLREDETVLTGEPASRRGLTEPHRVAREFKRRLGDTTPILLGGVPYSAEALMSRLLASIVEEVSSREGGPPAAICFSHPANWGPYKKDLLNQAVRLANIDQPVTFTTEPEAAAVFYATQQRIPAGAVVAVYDLGGGTFDAAVLRKTAGGFEILGQPEGIERLGGIDFDAAVFHHVAQAIGGKLNELDEDDPAAIAAVGRLREECVAAKEALSSDTDATIPVLLPNLATEVRLTRAELEAMVRPALYQTIEALRRALRSANVTPEQLHAVLLVGGSSRMPLVAQLVGAELGRPVAVDAHPKHAVALGAAWLASGTVTDSRPAPATPAAPADPAPRTRATASVPHTATTPLAPTSPAGVAGPVAAGFAGAQAGGPPVAPTTGDHPRTAYAGPPTTRPVPPVPQVQPVQPVQPVPPVRSNVPAQSGPATYGGHQPVSAAPPVGPSSTAAGAPAAPPPQPPVGGGHAAGDDTSTGNRRLPMMIAAAAAAVLLLGGGVAYAVTRLGGGEDPGGGPGTQPSASPQALDSATEAPSPSPSPEETLPPDERCTDQIQANPRWVCLTSATYQDGQLVVEFEAEWAGDTPTIRGGYHVHLYGSDGTNPPDEIMGNHAANRGQWLIYDSSPIVVSGGDLDQLGDYPKVCARIANGDHHLVPAEGGGYRTGNCLTIEGY